MSNRWLGRSSVLGVLLLLSCTTVENQPGVLPELKTQFGNATPDYVKPEALHCVVVVTNEAKNRLGSAIAISETRLLTAAHVIDTDVGDDGVVELLIDGELLQGKVVAMGDQETPHGDWAILEFESGHWDAVATIHDLARNQSWAPPAGTELLLVGYAAGFFPDLKVNIDEPPPAVVVRMSDIDSDDEWLAKGANLHLGGMSGGAAMIWNSVEQRGELVGVLHGYLATTIEEQEIRRFLGIEISRHIERTPGVAFVIHRLPAAMFEE